MYGNTNRRGGQHAPRSNAAYTQSAARNYAHKPGQYSQKPQYYEPSYNHQQQRGAPPAMRSKKNAPHYREPKYEEQYY